MTHCFFGIVFGPLLWGLVAAFVIRATQSMFLNVLVISCYVDDPILATTGAEEEINERFAIIILLWRMLGFNLALRKAMQGQEVDWIGINFKVELERQLLVAIISDAKVQEAKALIAVLWASGTYVQEPVLRRFTGLVEWMAGLLTQLKPPTQICWAVWDSKTAAEWVDLVTPSPARPHMVRVAFSPSRVPTYSRRAL